MAARHLQNRTAMQCVARGSGRATRARGGEALGRAHAAAKAQREGWAASSIGAGRRHSCASSSPASFEPAAMRPGQISVVGRVRAPSPAGELPQAAGRERRRRAPQGAGRLAPSAAPRRWRHGVEIAQPAARTHTRDDACRRPPLRRPRRQGVGRSIVLRLRRLHLDEPRSRPAKAPILSTPSRSTSEPSRPRSTPRRTAATAPRSISWPVFAPSPRRPANQSGSPVCWRQ